MKVVESNHTSSNAAHLENMALRMRVACAEGLPQTSVLLKALDHHLLRRGGQMRARLSLQTSALLGIGSSTAIDSAGVVELIHNASLVQDDLQDRTPDRRGQESVWKKFGGDVAIGLTDLMVSGTYHLASSLPGKDLPMALRHIHRAIAETLHGQSLDLEGPKDGRDGFEHSLQAAASKSGPFLALGIELPMILAGHHNMIPVVQEAGKLIGFAYQLLDDIIDIEEDLHSGHRSNAGVLALVQKKIVGQTPLQDLEKRFQNTLSKVDLLAKEFPDQSGLGLSHLGEKLREKMSKRICDYV